MKSVKVVLFALLLGAFGCNGQTYKSLNNDEFEQFISNANVQLVDVRTAEEFANTHHIAGAQNIDVKKADFVEIAQHKLDKNKPVAVYCLHGKRSKIAAAKLVDLGYKVSELNTGIEAWEKAQKPVE